MRARIGPVRRCRRRRRRDSGRSRGPRRARRAVITLPRSSRAAVVPRERLAQPVLHADVEVEHDEDRRLQPVGEVERQRAEFEAFARVLGQQQHVLRVAVRRVRARHEVGLLRARRHAGRRAAALHVEQHGRDLGEIREPEEFLHQRNARARRRGERARAVPRRADHHADRRELVLGLHDRVALLAGRRIGAELAAPFREALGKRRRRRDRIPRGDRRAAVDGAERRRGVAVDEDPVADRVAARDRKPIGHAKFASA